MDHDSLRARWAFWDCQRNYAHGASEAVQPGTKHSQISLLLKLLVACVGGGACTWGAWYVLVLKAAQRRLQPWGPQWLAIGLSSALSRFAR
eukprot:5081132-Amphidinium_carterae.1